MDSCLEQLHDAITTATRGMTTKELTRRPKGKWSCAEILEHLYLTYTGTVKGFERCWEAGKPLAGSLTLKQRLAIALVVDAGYFPEGRQAPERTRPKGMPAEKVVAEVRQQIAQMDEWIGKCEARYEITGSAGCTLMKMTAVFSRGRDLTGIAVGEFVRDYGRSMRFLRHR